MKIAFLDIDGVVATQDAFDKELRTYFGSMKEAELAMKKRGGDKDTLPFPRMSMEYWTFCNRSIRNLYILHRTTKCKFVVCSSWRTGRTVEELSHLFSIKGLKIPVYDRTGRGETRGEEISAWLKGKDVEQYVIIDDECYWDIIQHHPNNCVQPTFKKGFTNECLRKAIKILGG